MSYLDTKHVRFNYAQAGAGPPVLLLPGGGGWRLTFRTMIPILSERHTVYALDPPGQGLTEVVDPQFSHDADGIAYAIADFLDAVGVSRAAIVGHSWGGGYALRLAELQPDRVPRLALLAPGGIDVADAWEFRLMRLPVVGEVALRAMSKAFVRHMLRKSFVHWNLIPEDLIGEQVRIVRSGPGRAARLRTMLRVERSVRWTETERDLHQVTAPVLLLWGTRDRYFPIRLMERFTARLPNVESHALDRCGHSLHDDCPQQAHPLLSEFLERAWL